MSLLITAVFVALLVLKLMGVISCSWCIVFLPITITMAIIFALLGLFIWVHK
jgi:hypothetical protein